MWCSNYYTLIVTVVCVLWLELFLQNNIHIYKRLPANEVKMQNLKLMKKKYYLIMAFMPKINIFY